MRKQLTKLKTVFFELNYQCNLTCKHCYNLPKAAEADGFYQLSYYKNVLDQLKKQFFF